jgi:hypothetical protein
MSTDLNLSISVLIREICGRFYFGVYDFALALMDGNAYKGSCLYTNVSKMTGIG